MEGRAPEQVMSLALAYRIESILRFTTVSFWLHQIKNQQVFETCEDAAKKDTATHSYIVYSFSTKSVCWRPRMGLDWPS